MLNHSRLLSSLVVALAAALAVACSESPTALTETEPDDPPPSLDFENAPVTSGPFIIRFESGFSLGITDSDRELLGLHQLDDSLLGCREATAESERLTVQAILRPDGPVQFLARSDATFTAVFDLRGLTAIPTDPEELCDFLLGPRRIAEGFSRFTLTENDLLDSGVRRRTFSFKGNGQLQDLSTDGDVSYNSNARLLERDDGTLEVLVSDVVLGPDPR